jgi:hypothetical protein
MTTNELSDRLREQVGFLDTSCRLYDEGDAAEAKRLATTARALLVDTRSMKSLLGQLGLLQRLLFEDTAGRLHPGNYLPEANLMMLAMGPGQDGELTAMWTPRMGLPAMQDYPPMAFEDWWSEPVIKDGDGNLFSREKIVRQMGDKEGHHIDPHLPTDYWKLSRENSMGWKVVDARGETPMFSNPVLPAMRQIAHEVLATFKRHESDLRGFGVEAPDPPPWMFTPPT